MSETFWNGMPTRARRGTAIIADAPEFTDYWARDFIGERWPVVEVVFDGVNRGGGIGYISDVDGLGWRKVTAGRGGPRHPHQTIRIEPESFVPVLSSSTKEEQ